MLAYVYLDRGHVGAVAVCIAYCAIVISTSAWPEDYETLPPSACFTRTNMIEVDETKFSLHMLGIPGPIAVKTLSGAHGRHGDWPHAPNDLSPTTETVRKTKI